MNEPKRDRLVASASVTDRGRPLVIGAGFIRAHMVQRLQAAGVAPRVPTRSPIALSVRQRLGEPDIFVGDAAIRLVVETHSQVSVTSSSARAISCRSSPISIPQRMPPSPCLP